MTSSSLTPAEATALVIRTLERCRTGADNAAAVARGLIGAELAGQYGHGLRRMPAYGGQALSGKVDGFATPALKVLKPGAALVDAGHGFSYPALDLALDWLPRAAQANGIAIAGICNSSHGGVAGLPVERLAEAGCLGIMVANAPASMAPWGGKRPLFGTDPIAFAAPLEGADPVVVDLSLSKVAKGKIMAARQKGEPIPEGWALDIDGNPTTDAEAAMKGTMVPMGDAKGTALALMVEMLCAGLIGAHYAWEVPGDAFFDLKGPPPGMGQTLIAIDAGTFGSHVTARLAEMAVQLEGVEGARLPGRRRQQTRRRIAAEGIAVDADLMAQIEALGR
ncbi:Ldh family oxidoreductase [Pseudooceanicola sp. CBS1P-1]|uniref:Ldh family oxidoreductase n=1 Tax=Pseudooceanicola albus TaxID=2692189 RepID=A0A6L7G9P5_9RHOB|nr:MULTISPECIES: Ldh family oxidoreductase [Pseudooceanicola]MBT9385788.1 Ldh family oxidoreductase [Pseudooceanicola endophyticus]MXN20020.1 Ldh family oxidoreductase [Pseudooceanicola albus]